MDKKLLINLNLNITQDFTDLKTATERELNYLKEDLKSFYKDYLDPKLKYRNAYINKEAIKIENDIHRKIVNLEKRVKKLKIIIKEKVLTKDNEFYEFYCELQKIHKNDS